MSTHPFLKSPPIIEALIDFRVLSREDFESRELHSVASQLASTYPDVQEQRQLEWKVQHKPGEAPLQTSTDLGVTGLRLESPDRQRVIQLRQDGLTASWLRPYKSWGALMETAMPAWDAYLALTRPRALVRVATRYINRLELLEGQGSADDLMRYPLGPVRVAGLGYGPMLYRTVLTQAQTGNQANLSLAYEAGVDGRPRAIVVDVDAYRIVESMSLEESPLTDVLESLHLFKNDLFFGAVSDRGIERCM